MQTDVSQPTKKLLNSEHMGNFVKVGEYNIHYYAVGEGTPLLLIHGIGQSLYTWHNCIDELSKEHRVYAIDLIGYGYSDKPIDMLYTIDNMMEFINRFMEAIDLGKAHVIAVSSGAMIALRLAQKYPYRVGRMTLISPGGVTPEMPLKIRALRSPITSWLFKMFLDKKTTTACLNDCFFDQTHVTPQTIDQYYTPITDGGARNVLVRNLTEFDETETMQELNRIQNDIQIIWGHEDRWHPVDMAEQFHLSLSNSNVSVIRNCGHFPHEEKSDRFLEITIPFFHTGLLITPEVKKTVEDQPSNFGHLLHKLDK